MNWTDKETSFLKENFHLGAEFCQKNINGGSCIRSLNSIKKKAYALKLGHKRERTKINKLVISLCDDDRKILQNISNTLNISISAFIRDACINEQQQFQLTKPKEKSITILLSDKEMENFIQKAGKGDISLSGFAREQSLCIARKILTERCSHVDNAARI